VSPEEERRRLVEERAYGLSRERGAGVGSPEKDWLTAEREVDERLQARSQRLKELGEAANTSATHVNVSFLTFMFVWTFVALAVSATTDEQLLRVNPLPMPLVGLSLPIVEFFAVVPYFILLPHLNLLLQLYLLSRRLHALDQELEEVSDPAVRRLQRLKLFPLPFSQFLIGRDPRRCIHVLLAGFVGITVILMPLALLSWLELRFLPYHHATVPWIQRVAVILDAVLVLGLWPLVLRWDEARSRTLTASARSRTGRASAWTAFVLLVLMFPAFSSLVALWPGEPWEAKLANIVPSFLLVDPRRAEWPLQWYPGKRYLAATHWFFDRTGAWFRRNLSVSDAVLLAQKPDPAILVALTGSDANAREQALTRVVGLNLRGRNLVWADFGRCILSKADLRGAKLDGAYLERADLSAARLAPGRPTASITIQASDWRFALEERPASLRGAYLWAAHLQEADLVGVQLQSAHLEWAQLQGADLGTAQMQGAHLDWAQLQSAHLDWAQLQDAYL
jgi:hypothetical protein